MKIMKPVQMCCLWDLAAQAKEDPEAVQDTAVRVPVPPEGQDLGECLAAQEGGFLEDREDRRRIGEDLAGAWAV